MALPPDEIDKIANTLLDPMTFNRLWSVTQESQGRIPRAEPEQDLQNRIAKLVDWSIEEDLKRSKAIREVIRLGAYGPVQQLIEDAKREQGAFGQSINELQKALGDVNSGSLSAIKRVLDQDDARHQMMKSLSGGPSIADAFAKMQGDAVKNAQDSIFGSHSSPQLKHIAVDDAMIRQHQLIREERTKELDDLNLMADASITTARVMNKLSNDVLEFMTKFVEAASANHLAQDWSVKFALATFVISAVLTFGALIFAILSFRQDQANNESNDKWQVRVESLLAQQLVFNGEMEKLKEENQLIRTQLDAFNANAKSERQLDESEKSRAISKHVGNKSRVRKASE